MGSWKEKDQANRYPEILAPAGSKDSFLAALAAGADAIYLGLKNFSARMEAENFSLTELSRLADLAHAKNVRVYCTMNTMVKESELMQCYQLIMRLEKQVHCDGLIVQDLAYPELCRQAGFTGGIFFSTLANITHPEILSQFPNLGVSRVILPRELSLDELEIMNDACPDTLTMEIFVHGALCYCVSGRCYWSSYMGGKSGLRGRCVQPCRRQYTLQYTNIQKRSKKPSEKGVEKTVVKNGRSAQFFSCQDLSLACATKDLLKLSHICSWKIEGRKKGPHYVYHCVRAYRILRDNPNDRAAEEEAAQLLDMALGRPTTQARFFPKKPLVPTNPSTSTSSGLCIGSLIPCENGGQIRPKIALQKNDFLRVGYEDEKWHQTLHLSANYPKGSSIPLSLSSQKIPPKPVPVFLIDRRENVVVDGIRALSNELKSYEGRTSQPVSGKLVHPKPLHALRRPDMKVLGAIPVGKDNRAIGKNMLALWLSPKSAAISKTVARRIYFWLPPVVWPNESKKIAHLIHELWRDGCRHFVANAPWQRVFFPSDLPEDADLVAGPFCNVSNALSLAFIAKLGFCAAFVSQELSEETILSLPKVSPLPLGFVLEGFWPVGISRFGLLGVKQKTPFVSPKGEEFWVREYGQNVWIYPAWSLDLSEKKGELLHAGYSFFATLHETKPQMVSDAKRPGLFNWSQPLL